MSADLRLRVLSLFAGIGGIDLGLERAGGFVAAAFCERAEFQQRVLRKHWKDVPIYDDVCALTAGRLAADGISVDVVAGGFPCQPFSTASRGRRVAIDRWPEMLRIVGELCPRYVIAENVSEKAIANAAGDLAQLGYRTDHRCISADAAGADHQRDRWWLCAHPHDEGEFRRALDAEVAQLPALCRGLWGPGNYARAVRVPDGVPNRMDRLISLGNAVIPAIPEAIGRAINVTLAAPKDRHHAA